MRADSRSTVSPWVIACAGVFTLVVGVAACTTIVTIPSPRQYVADSQPKHIWVTRQFEPDVKVDAPAVRGDTLVGLINGEPERIPFSTILSATIRRESTDKIVKVSVGIGATVVAALIVYKITHQRSFTPQP